MKTKNNYSWVLLSLFAILFSTSNLMAVPYPVKEANSIDYEKSSIKEIEKQLDRKLNWKEKVAIRKIKKLAKKERRKRKVKIKLYGKIKIKGNLSKIRNDSIFISDYLMKWSTKVGSKAQRGEEIGIPINLVDKILLVKTPGNAVANAIFYLAALAFFLATIFFIAPGDKRFIEAEGFSRTTIVGGLFTFVGGIFLLIGAIVKGISHLGSWLKLNGGITPEQMETLSAYLMG